MKLENVYKYTQLIFIITYLSCSDSTACEIKDDPTAPAPTWVKNDCKKIYDFFAPEGIAPAKKSLNEKNETLRLVKKMIAIIGNDLPEELFYGLKLLERKSIELIAAEKPIPVIDPNNQYFYEEKK